MKPQAQGSEKPSRETVAEAAAWISRLHSSRRSREVEAGFRDWLAADERNARVFEEMNEIWETMPGVNATEVFAQPAPQERTMRCAEATTAPRRTWTWVAVAASAGFCVVVLCTYLLLRHLSYSTSVGEERIVNLEDGTRVSLNASTQITVNFDKAQRRIDLVEGEAFFEVAHHPQRPFIVVAGGNRVTALGTTFAVRYERDRTAVTLIEGKVSVASVELLRGEPIAPARTTENTTDSWSSKRGSTLPAAHLFAQGTNQVLLEPGERLTLAASAPPRIDTPKIEALTAWRRGEIILDETGLSEAVAEMNRYDKTALVIDDPDLTTLQVSGIYRTGDSLGFANIVARMYNLAVSEEDGRIHLKNSRP